MMSAIFSNPLRLMARPFRVYREIAAQAQGEEEARALLVLGALRFMFVLGGFVAITSIGRLSPIETIVAMVSFAWLPIVHSIGIATSRGLFSREVSFKRAYALYLEGVGPWLIVLLIISGACLFAPQPARPVFMLLAPLVLVGTLWSIVLTFALFRAGLGLGRVRALLATVIFYVVLHVLILGYYFTAGQLWPILAF